MTLAEERKEGNKTIHVWKLTEEETVKAKKEKEEAETRKAEKNENKIARSFDLAI